jgi:hypothetical protein
MSLLKCAMNRFGLRAMTLVTSLMRDIAGRADAG